MDLPPKDESSSTEWDGGKNPELDEQRRARILRSFSRVAARLRTFFGVSENESAAFFDDSRETEILTAQKYAQGVNDQLFNILTDLATVPQDPNHPRNALSAQHPEAEEFRSDYKERVSQWTFGVSAGAIVDEPMRPYYTPLVGEGFGNLVLEYRIRRQKITIPVRDILITMHYGHETTGSEPYVTSSLSINHHSTPTGEPSGDTGRFDANIEIGVDGELVRINVGDHFDGQGPHAVSLMALSTNFEHILAGVNASIVGTTQAYKDLGDLG